MLKLSLFFVLLFSFFSYGAELTENEFLKIKKELTPDSSEPWKTIPWKLSVLEAQKVASESKKPIFIWPWTAIPSPAFETMESSTVRRHLQIKISSKS